MGLQGYQYPFHARQQRDLQPAIRVIKANRPHSRPPSGIASNAIKQGRDQASPKKQCLKKGISPCIGSGVSRLTKSSP